MYNDCGDDDGDKQFFILHLGIYGWHTMIQLDIDWNSTKYDLVRGVQVTLSSQRLIKNTGWNDNLSN